MKPYGEMLDPSGIQYKWNSSSLSVADACLRKYEYAILHKWHRGEANIHLRFGGIYANAQQRFYLSLAEGKHREDAIEDAIALALEQSWERFPCPSCTSGMRDDGETCIYTGCTAGQVSRPWDSGDNYKNRFNLIRSLVWYFEEFKDDLPVVQVNGAPAVEVKFELDVDDGQVFVGTLDRIVQYGDDPFVMDQKTTKSAIGPYYFKGYKPDMQMSMYTFAGTAVFASPLRGVIIDVAQMQVGATKFNRGMTFRTPSELAEWYDETMELIEEVRFAVQENHFPRRPASCGNYGGCPFREVCSASPEARPNFLRHGFVQGDTE